MDIKSTNISASAFVTAQPVSNSAMPKADQGLDKQIKESKLTMDNPQTGMGFILDEDLSENMVAVIKDRKTDETIRLVPSEEQLKIKKGMAESTGLILDLIA